MPNEIVTVNSRAFDGSIRRTWTCELIRRDGPMLELVGTFESDISHADLGSISRGTVSFEYYWLDRWYNIFRFESPVGTLRNYYCNINMPPAFENGVLDYVDLDVDIVVWPDGSLKVLDEQEFAANAAAFRYPREVLDRVNATREELLELIAANRLP